MSILCFPRLGELIIIWNDTPFDTLPYNTFLWYLVVDLCIKLITQRVWYLYSTLTQRHVLNCVLTFCVCYICMCVPHSSAEPETHFGCHRFVEEVEIAIPKNVFNENIVLSLLAYEVQPFYAFMQTLIRTNNCDIHACAIHATKSSSQTLHLSGAITALGHHHHLVRSRSASTRTTFFLITHKVLLCCWCVYAVPPPPLCIKSLPYISLCHRKIINTPFFSLKWLSTRA